MSTYEITLPKQTFTVDAEDEAEARSVLQSTVLTPGKYKASIEEVKQPEPPPNSESPCPYCGRLLREVGIIYHQDDFDEWIWPVEFVNGEFHLQDSPVHQTVQTERRWAVCNACNSDISCDTDDNGAVVFGQE